MPHIANDIQSVEVLLQKFALQAALFGKPKTTLQQRLNRTLNIQWAIDLKNSFSAN